MPNQNNPAQNRELHQTLIEINCHLKRLASYRHNFCMSLIRGLGFAIGSTIILGIFIAVLIRFASIFLNDLQFLQDLPTQLELQQQIPDLQNYENQINPSYN